MAAPATPVEPDTYSVGNQSFEKGKTFFQRLCDSNQKASVDLPKKKPRRRYRMIRDNIEEVDLREALLKVEYPSGFWTKWQKSKPFRAATRHHKYELEGRRYDILAWYSTYTFLDHKKYTDVENRAFVLDFAQKNQVKPMLLKEYGDEPAPVNEPPMSSKDASPSADRECAEVMKYKALGVTLTGVMGNYKPYADKLKDSDTVDRMIRHLAQQLLPFQEENKAMICKTFRFEDRAADTDGPSDGTDDR